MLTFSDFTAFIDSIYFEGYANQLAATDPEKLQFEFEEYQAVMAQAKVKNGAQRNSPVPRFF